VAILCFLLGFGTIPTVWHYWFFYWHLELIRQCGVTGFSMGLPNCSDSVPLLVFYMGLWNCSDSVAFFIFLLDFGTAPTVWRYLFLYRTLQLFRHCGIIGFSFCYWTLELFRQCGIIYFSIGHWNCSDIVPLFVLLLDFGTVPRVWHYWFFIFLLDFGTVPTVWHYLF
jgi:hypothetical protein